MTEDKYDLLVIGAGINGAGIARDAAGRGLRVLVVEKDDIASATSSWSSKLIHGGLRYLEQYEFRLVREALQEREVLLRLAPHIIHPLRFVLPHVPSMRPAWMVRIGLWMYDHLGSRVTLPGSHAVAFPDPVWSAGLKPDFPRGYAYSDCQVDDSRLTLVNAISAAEKGATVLTRTRFVSGERRDGAWEARLEGPAGPRTVRARAVVNAAGPWVMDVLAAAHGTHVKGSVRLVKGSHIIVPRIHPHGHAYILQNPDQRVIFLIPYQGFTLVGTTDVQVPSTDAARDISGEEVDYLIAAANRFVAKPLARADVVSSYAGVRPLYDDGSDNVSQITRDYVLRLDEEGGRAPLITLFGGKITTYRCLAEEVVAKLAPYFPGLPGPWSANEALPGGDVGDWAAFREAALERHRGVGPATVEGILMRHGSRAGHVLGDAKAPGDLGRDFGGGLTEREIAYVREREWATTAEDILWRRTKCGLHMDAAQREAVSAFVGR